jgi:hypothetical protein
VRNRGRLPVVFWSFCRCPLKNVVLVRALFALLVFVPLMSRFSSAVEAAEGEVISSTCSTAVATASDINAFKLFEGVALCSGEGRQADTNFLVIVGQVRAMADLAILRPVDEPNAKGPGKLYLQVLYKYGGLGFDEFYRTPSNVSDLEKRIRAADLSLKEGYDPGWAYRPSSKTDIYSQIVSNTLERRLWQMRSVALKLQNDEYYKAHLAISKLRKANLLFKEGTPAFKEHSRLMAQIQEVAKTIPLLPEPKDTLPHERLNEQDPEMAERQVAMGFNGPAKGEIFVISSEADFRKSWLADALTEQQGKELIAKTDFSTQALVIYSFGRRMNASGNILVSKLSYYQGNSGNSGNSGYSIYTRFGVVPESCGVSFAESYPFVVGVTKAGSESRVLSSGSSNFPDKCGPIVSGQPVGVQ